MSFFKGKSLVLILLILLIAFPFFTYSIDKSKTNAKTAKRIVSLAPSITETLFALGLNREVVGVTNFCELPSNVSIARVGGFVNPNIETIVSLRPDLVIATMDGNPQKPIEELKHQGIAVLVIKTDSFSDIITSIKQIGEATNNSSEAKMITAAMESEIGKIKDALINCDKVKVLLVHEHNPLIAAGKNTFDDDIIKLCGGENISESSVRYPRLDMEFIVTRQPEVIIETCMVYNSKPDELLAFWQKWNEIPAVKNGRIYFIPPSLIARPGPRILEGMKMMARYLHPEAF